MSQTVQTGAKFAKSQNSPFKAGEVSPMQQAATTMQGAFLKRIEDASERMNKTCDGLAFADAVRLASEGEEDPRIDNNLSTFEY
jgi:hypothetical protein